MVRGIWHEIERLRSLLSSRVEFTMVSEPEPFACTEP